MLHRHFQNQGDDEKFARFDESQARFDFRQRAARKLQAAQLALGDQLILRQAAFAAQFPQQRADDVCRVGTVPQLASLRFFLRSPFPHF